MRGRMPFSRHNVYCRWQHDRGQGNGQAPTLCHPNGDIGEAGRHCQDGENFRFRADYPISIPVSQGRAESWMGPKPDLKLAGTPGKRPDGYDKKDRCRDNRQEYTDDAQPNHDESERQPHPTQHPRVHHQGRGQVGRPVTLCFDRFHRMKHTLETIQTRVRESPPHK